MTKRIATPACTAIACAVAVLAAQQNRPASVDERIARIEGHLVPAMVVKGQLVPAMGLAERMRFYNTPGVSLAVINGGVVEWTRGYGVTEAEGERAVTPHTRFQAASISKPVTALAALRLVEQGRLALDENVNSRLTSWKVPDNEFTRQEKVTLRRLLSHSAGLTVQGFPGYAADAPVPSLVQVLDGVTPANTVPIRVDVVPGSLWRYSGGGYTIVQQLLVDVAGRPFPALMRDLVLQPLGMIDSTYEQPLPGALRADAASGHGTDGKVISGQYHTYPEMAAAGLWTTAADLARFAVGVQQAMAGRSNVLSRATAKEMLTLQKGTYGLGLSLSGKGRSARFGHGGSNAGFQCGMVAYVDTGQGAVVMTNGDRGGMLAGEILRAIALEYDWPEYPGGTERTIARIDPAVYQAYVGAYEMAPGSVIEIRAAGGKMTAKFPMPGTPTVELLPESATTFFDPVLTVDIVFVAGPDGATSHLLMNGAIRARRLPER